MSLDWLDDCPLPLEEQPKWVAWMRVCPPRYATRRTWERPTLGGQVSAMAELLGWTMMPWQQFVLDVAFEYELKDVEVRDPETGEQVERTIAQLCYRTIIGTVPRQSGKTSLGLPIKIHRALAFPETAPAPYGGPQNIVYTAQDRSRAFKKFSKEQVPRIKRCKALTGEYVVRMTTGSEGVIWNNGSFYGIDSSTAEAGHGDTLDLAFMDEAFALPDSRLEQAFVPAMITRPNAQLHIWSTQGDNKRVWFLGKCKKGREIAKQGRTDSTAYFEWAAPEGSKRLDDPELWPKFHPACGFTQTPASLIAAAESMEDPLDAMRAFFNWHRHGDTFESVIPADKWSKSEDGGSKIVSPSSVLAIDVNPARSHAAVATAGRNDDGKLHGEVVEYRPGTEWVVRRVKEICSRNSIEIVALDPTGPAGSLLTSLEEAGLEVKTISAREHANSCGLLFDAVENDNFAHLGQDELTQAAMTAQKRDLGDSWAWRRSSNSEAPDISPLVAVTLAIGQVPNLRPPEDETPTTLNDLFG